MCHRPVLTFRATAEVPEETGAIVAVEWDFDGAGTFHVESPVVAAEKATIEQQYSFSEPGTYFPAVRVVAHRDGDASAIRAVQNLACVRVVVSRSAEG